MSTIERVDRYKMTANPGDQVKIITEKEEFTGILMPRPALLEEGYVVIKLDNGYNIGIEEKKIKKIELVEKYSPKKIESLKIKTDPKLPTVSVLSIGGTISSRIDYKTGGVIADYTAEDFVAMIPELADIANLKAKKIMAVMTEDFTNNDWKLMAKEIAKELNDAKIIGVVITMGTDMLHFAASALSFFLRDLNKPVIITGAQRSIDRGSSDAFMNLMCSVTAAAKANIAEVMTCLHGTTSDDYCILNRGTKVRKMHTSRRDAFRPINELPIAKIYPDGKIDLINSAHKNRQKTKVSVDDKFEQKTALITVYPDMDPEIIDFYVDKGYKGIVIAATALGHVPQKIYPNVEKAVKKGIPIIIASQTLYGRTHPLVYSALRMLSLKLKCIFVEDMLPETAFIKLAWVLGHTTKIEEVRKMMTENIAGEITEKTNDNSFLY